MSNAYRSNEQSTNTPAVSAVAVNTAVLTEFAVPTRALYVGTLGDLDVVMADGSEVVFTGAVGLLPIRVKAIKAASTALNVVALF